MRNISGLKRWTLEARYQTYVNQYKKLEKKLQTVGQSMNVPMYSIDEYQFQYASLSMTRQEEGRSQGNINRDLAAKQAYSLSASQARSIAQYRNVSGLSNIWQIRAEGKKFAKEFFDNIRDVYAEQKALGATSTDARAYIAQEFFGS